MVPNLNGITVFCVISELITLTWSRALVSSHSISDKFRLKTSSENSSEETYLTTT